MVWLRSGVRGGVACVEVWAGAAAASAAVAVSVSVNWVEVSCLSVP